MRSFLRNPRSAWALLALAVVCLYAPWLGNPLIFDDLGFYKTGLVFDYAPYPFSLQARQFPYFTLGLEYMLSGGDVGVSRFIALLIHAANVGMLYSLLARLRIDTTAPDATKMPDTLALCVALVFAVHPVATYGVGYLVQRTILLACFFLLASAHLLLSGVEKKSMGKMVAAGLLYGMAVMSKEHAVAGAASLFMLGCMARPTEAVTRRVLWLWAAFLTTCAPFVLWVALSRMFQFWGVAYEPDVALLSAQPLDQGGNLHLNSALYQCWFFFRYWFFWWFPTTHWMSIDIRPHMDFGADRWLLLTCALAYALSLLLCAWAVLRRPCAAAARLGLAGLGWVAALFLVELTTVRFQEPLVLYRSYLWSPGYMLLLAAALQIVPVRLRLAAWVLPLLLLWPMQERMRTQSSDLLLWGDAVQKLDDIRRPDGVRTLYNRGMAHLALKQPELAMADFAQIIQNKPDSFEGYWARSSAHNALGQTAKALIDVETVLRINPKFGAAYFRQGFLAHRLGDLEKSKAAFAVAKTYGFPDVDLSRDKGKP